MDLTKVQKEILETEGHQLVTGGPGSGKTTVSILKAAKIARNSLQHGQRILFLSFARATVSRVIEAINEEKQISRKEKALIDVDTYHAFFWRILKTHGYLVGLPRRISILTPPNEAIALSSLRSEYEKESKLSTLDKIEKNLREVAELKRLALTEGKVCFNMFATKVGELLHGSNKVRNLISTAYPFIILDEFQDTNREQWNVIKALGVDSTLIALADPEQRIFDFIGADPERLAHFKNEFHPSIHDLLKDNHRSKGTDIALFGNDILSGRFSKPKYDGIGVVAFPPNENQAFSNLIVQVLQARERLIKSGKHDWSLAILVPTKKMTRLVSDAFHRPFGSLHPISHFATIDMDGPILAAEIVAYLLQQNSHNMAFDELVDLMCNYYQGIGGSHPTKKALNTANTLRSALTKWHANIVAGKPPPGKNVLKEIATTHQATTILKLSGDPDKDWRMVRASLDASNCPHLKKISDDVRNIRLLERGTQLRQSLIQDWLDNGAYKNALNITRRAFIQEHFSTTQKPETGVLVMNMHKAKGKQFDEVIIFEGWPRRVKRKIVANPDRILNNNLRTRDMSQARQNLRVSITRAKNRTTILTPQDDPCILLP